MQSRYSFVNLMNCQHVLELSYNTHTQHAHTFTRITSIAAGKAERYLVPAINTNQKPLYLIRTTGVFYLLPASAFLFADTDWV